MKRIIFILLVLFVFTGCKTPEFGCEDSKIIKKVNESITHIIYSGDIHFLYITKYHDMIILHHSRGGVVVLKKGKEIF